MSQVPFQFPALCLSRVPALHPHLPMLTLTGQHTPDMKDNEERDTRQSNIGAKAVE